MPGSVTVTRRRPSRCTMTSCTTLVHVLRSAAEYPFNYRVECCRAPVGHADTPGSDLFRLLPRYVRDGVAPDNMAINIEHDISRNPHLLIVEGAQDRSAHCAQHRPQVLCILNGLEERAHRHIVIEPRNRAKDFVFAHVATYTPSREVDQISSQPQRAWGNISDITDRAQHYRRGRRGSVRPSKTIGVRSGGRQS